MREILFRAKDEASHKWVYGYYVHLPSAAGSVHIMQVPAGSPDESNMAYYIIPETLGQYTGLTDRNGKKIFEGDILNRTLLNSVESDFIYTVEWCEDCAMVVLPCITHEPAESDFTAINADELEVIGNIHDDPDLVEG